MSHIIVVQFLLGGETTQGIYYPLCYPNTIQLHHDIDVLACSRLSKVEINILTSISTAVKVVVIIFINAANDSSLALRLTRPTSPPLWYHPDGGGGVSIIHHHHSPSPCGSLAFIHSTTATFTAVAVIVHHHRHLKRLDNFALRLTLDEEEEVAVVEDD
eukprot:scaffold23_cov101-Skeletonema_dohrnii-CCMP3373.AAC.8